MIRKQTIEYKIVSLIGLAGEVQTEELYKLKYGKEYIRKTISKLITKKYIKVYKFNNNIINNEKEELLKNILVFATSKTFNNSCIYLC